MARILTLDRLERGLRRAEYMQQSCWLDPCHWSGLGCEAQQTLPNKSMCLGKRGGRNRYRKLPRFTTKLPNVHCRTTKLPNLKSAVFGSYNQGTNGSDACMARRPDHLTGAVQRQFSTDLKSTLFSRSASVPVHIPKSWAGQERRLQRLGQAPPGRPN
jgi:hypothetical protein